MNAGSAYHALEQTRREEAFVTRLLRALQQLRDAVSAGRWQDLAELLPEQDRLIEEGARLRQARRTAAEATQGVHFAASLGPMNARLRTLAAEAQRQGESSIVMCNYHLDFMQRFFTELTTTSGNGCYGREGTLQRSSRGPLIEARG